MLDGREVRIEPAPGGVSVASATAELAQPVRRYLGGPFDLDAFAAFAATEPVLAEVVPALRGFRPPLVPDPFETLVTSITAQQISLRAAASIRNRLIETFGERHEVAHAFPSRERLALAPPEGLVAVGFSRRKAEYVVGLARSELDLDGLALLPEDEVRARLVALPGIGDWTAQYIAMRGLGDPDAFPTGDLGLRIAVSNGDRIPARPSFSPPYDPRSERVRG